MSEKLQILSKINLLSSLLHYIENWVFVGYLGFILDTSYWKIEQIYALT